MDAATKAMVLGWVKGMGNEGAAIWICRTIHCPIKAARELVAEAQG